MSLKVVSILPWQLGSQGPGDHTCHTTLTATKASPPLRCADDQDQLPGLGRMRRKTPLQSMSLQLAASVVGLERGRGPDSSVRLHPMIPIPH